MAFQIQTEFVFSVTFGASIIINSITSLPSMMGPSFAHFALVFRSVPPFSIVCSCSCSSSFFSVQTHVSHN